VSPSAYRKRLEVLVACFMAGVAIERSNPAANRG